MKAQIADRKQNTKKRVRDPLAKREAILTASLKEFSQHGFAGARADKIALAAQVSIGTVFKIFKDKNGLANALYTECLQRIQAKIGPALIANLTPREAFDQMWAAYTELLFREPEVLMFFEYQPTSDFLDPENRLGLHKLRQGLVKWIEKHQATGVLKDTQSELLRAVAIGAIMRVLREAIDGNTKLNKSKLEELNRLVWLAIAK